MFPVLFVGHSACVHLLRGLRGERRREGERLIAASLAHRVCEVTSLEGRTKVASFGASRVVR